MDDRILILVMRKALALKGRYGAQLDGFIGFSSHPTVFD